MWRETTNAKKSRTLTERTDKFFSPICNRLLEYWRNQSVGKIIPTLKDINLMDVHDIAPNIVIRDAIDNGSDFRCRYYGTGIARILDNDHSGKTLVEAFEPLAARVAQERYIKALFADGPTRVVGYVELVETVVPKTFESILLPLSGSSGNREHVLCIYDFDYVLQEIDKATINDTTELREISLLKKQGNALSPNQ